MTEESRSRLLFGAVNGVVKRWHGPRSADLQVGPGQGVVPTFRSAG